MKHITIRIFAVLGVIFLVLILVGIYFFVTDPYGLKPLIFGDSTPTQSSSAPVTNIATDQETSGGFGLSNAQIEALGSFGIDPAAVPSSISAVQEACFVGVLGEERVREIKAGAVPSAFEFLKAKSCI